MNDSLSTTWNKKAVPVLELKRLLYELKDKQSYTGIRFRFLGEMWLQYFLRILRISESGAIFYDEASGKLLKLSNLSSIIQFELDHNFQNYQAHFHYDVSVDDSV